MRVLLALILAALAVRPAAAQPADSARVVLDAALDAMQAKGYYAARVDWPAVRARAYAQAADARTPSEAYPAIREALAALGDGHSFLLTTEAQDGLAPAAADAAPRFLVPEGRVIDVTGGPVGYLRVPFFMGPDTERFADSLLAVVRRVDAARPAGWIVDVRRNGGGNIWPMLAGLAPILGDGVVGGFVGADGAREWIRLDGTAALVVLPDTSATVVRTTDTYRVARPLAPVAVLTDGATGSSAEGVALAFVGHPNSRRFGTATAGASSSNEGTPLPDGSVLVVTTGLMMDRTGRPYGVRIEPDTAAPDDLATPADETLDAALGWLREVGSATSDDRSDVGSTPQSVVDGLSCTHFEWRGVDGLSDRAALLVPVQFDGREARFQLDTGADVTMLYGGQPAERGWPVEAWFSPTARVPDVRLGGTDIGAVRMVVHSETEANDVAGTIGLDVLVGHVVVIDYPRQRFCLVPSGDAPFSLLGRAAFVPAEIRSGKLFVAATLGGEAQDGLFFDTGASLFPLQTDRADWERITGGAAPTDTLAVPSWDRELTFVGAPAAGDLQIGPVRLARPLVYTQPAAPTSYADWGFRARGLIGNAPFFDEIVVLDLRSRPLLGVLR